MHQILAVSLFVVANWSFNPIVWKANDTGLDATAYTSNFAIYKSDMHYQRVMVSAEVTVSESLGEFWKSAGVSVYQDKRNFWHFALIASPDEEPRHSIELGEMRDGVWLSHLKLKRTVDIKHGTWKLGETYRLMIALGEGWIEGRALDAKGEEIRRVRYEFNNPAVDRGKPALRCSGTKASFRHVECKMDLPVEPVEKTCPSYESKSFLSGIHGRKTGFFHVEQQDGHWVAIDPLGRGFLPLGVDHVSYTGPGCQALGYAPYGKKNREKYPDRKTWEDETLSRLETWGFNTLAGGVMPSMCYRGMIHASDLEVGRQFARLGDDYQICEPKYVPCSSFPNVFHPRFAEFCDYFTKPCEENADDPWLLGYFLDNELRWWGEPGMNLEEGLFDTCMAKVPTHTAKQALVAFLSDRYAGDVQKFNQAWKTSLAKFDDLYSLEKIPSETDKAVADKKAFVEKVADTYFKVITEAIRKHDPNHMILGCRFAGGNASEEVWKKAGEYCDVLTLNYYGNVNLDHGVAMGSQSPWRGETLREVFDNFHRMGQRPMLVTEWAFPALDAGLPSVHGAGQRFRTQAERTEASRIFAETLLRMPHLIGYDYFMWVDEPALGISKNFAEDSNYGLVNEENEPYALLTEMFTKLHRDAARLRREGFSKVGPPVKTPLVRKQTQGAKEQPGPMRFTRDGDRYEVTAGKWKLEGKLGKGPFWSKIVYQQDGHDVLLGRFNGLIGRKTTRRHWDPVVRVLKAAPVGDPNAPTAIDLVGQCHGTDGLYELAYRFAFFPKQDAMTAELLWCKNLSEVPIHVQGFYFQAYSDLGGDGKNDMPTRQTLPPRLWGVPLGDAWRDAPLGLYWGLAAQPDTQAEFNFWLGEKGDQHPDAHWEVDLDIQPGETYRPATPMIFISVAGKGDRDDWEKKVETALEKIAP